MGMLSCGYLSRKNETYLVEVNDKRVRFITDNGTIVPIEAGDVTFCPAGTGHGVMCVGNEPLELIALILYE